MTGRQLVSPLILNRWGSGQTAGRLTAAALFVDISGFTAVTTAFMRHGKEGAETVADLLENVFTPLITFINERGGTVTGFAGDALTAVFPGRGPAAHARAITTAAAWQDWLHTHGSQTTPLGTFRFSGRAGVARGGVTWGVVDTPAGRTSFVRGPAISRAAAAEKLAGDGEIVVSRAIINPFLNGVAVTPLSDRDHVRLDQIIDPLPLGRPRTVAAADRRAAADFHPRPLLESRVRGEFRQAVSLFVGVRGKPTRPQLTTLMTTVHTLVKKYDGFLGRLDFGDKGCHLLLFWGAPVSHENDLERALNFALELQQESKRPLRIGVTDRLVFAGFVGSPTRQEYTCYGSGVNQAARQMTAAGWGEIWVDEETAGRAPTRFTFASAGVHPFKGMADPQPIMILTGRRRAAGPFFTGRLVGRKGELDRLAEAVAPLHQGRFGGVWLISGEAGLGKSRLLHDFVASHPAAAGLNGVVCQTDEIVRQPFNPLRYWLRRYFQQEIELEADDNQSRFAAVFGSLVAVTDEPDLRRELERTRSFLAALVDLYQPDSLYESLTPELRLENTIIALKSLIKAESRRRPLILQLEDAQWLDAETINLLPQLVRNVDEYPFVIIATSRQADGAAAWGLPAPARELMLGTLTGEDVRALAENVFGEPIAPELAIILKERADGNPFFAEQLVLYLKEEGVLRPSPAGLTAGIDGTVLPLGVQAVVVARLDRLTEVLRNVVQTAAVLGREFEVQVLSRMLRGEGAIERRVDQAAAADIWAPLNEMRYLFKHALLRDAAYEMQLRQRLQQLHRLAAEAIEQLAGDDVGPVVADLAYHWGRAADDAQERRYAVLAAQQAAERYANSEAIRLFSRALELTENERERIELLLAREHALDRVADRPAQEQDLAALQAWLDDQTDPEDPLQSQILQRLSEYHRKVGQYDDARTFARRLIDLGETTGNFSLQAEGWHQFGWAFNMQGQYTQADQYLTRALQLLSAEEQPLEYGEILETLATSQGYRGRLEEADRSIQQAINIFQQLGVANKLATALNIAGLVAMRQSDYKTGRQLFEEALTINREIGARGSEAMILSNLGVSFYYLGDIGAARSLFIDALRVRQEINDRWGEAMSLNNVGVIYMDEGKLLEAVSYYRRCLDVCNEVGDLGNKVLALNNLGITMVKLGDYDAAERYLSDAVGVARESGDRVHEANALATFGYYYCYTDQLAQGVEHAEKAIALSTEIGDRLNVLYATQGLAHIRLAQGDFASAADLYRQTAADLAALSSETTVISAAGLVEGLRRGGRPFRAEAETLFEALDGRPPPITTNEPFFPYLVCYQALAALGDARANDILRQGYEGLQRTAGRLDDEQIRRKFLERIAVHREIRRLYENAARHPR